MDDDGAPIPIDTVTGEQLPSGAPAASPARTVLTPYIGMHFKEALDRQRSEDIEFELRSREPSRQLARLTVMEESLLAALQAAQEQLKRVSDEPGKERLRARRLVENARDYPDSVIERRRLAEHASVLAAAEKTVNMAAADCRKAEYEIAGLRAAIASERRVADARNQRIREHSDRRILSYWRHLIRHREHGAALNDRLQPAGPQLPKWTGAGTDDDARQETTDEPAR
jgi:chromosome condensin MukBEF ATPase and DNA-binding subunit MukB